MDRFELAFSHEIRGQQRYCELIQLAKHRDFCDQLTLLKALAIASGQFVKSDREHFEVCKSAMKDVGLNMAGWFDNSIQKVLFSRRMAQEFSGTVKRVRWAGWKYQKELRITYEESCYLGLKDIVKPSYRAPRTVAELRQQTKNATAALVDKTDKRATQAQNLRDSGWSIRQIAEALFVSTRTVFSYLGRNLSHLVKTRLAPSSIEERGGEYDRAGKTGFSGLKPPFFQRNRGSLEKKSNQAPKGCVKSKNPTLESTLSTQIPPRIPLKIPFVPGRTRNTGVLCHD